MTASSRMDEYSVPETIDRKTGEPIRSTSIPSADSSMFFSRFLERMNPGFIRTAHVDHE